MIRLLIADDHAVVRTGLMHLTATFDDIELVGAAEDGEEAVRLAADLRPDVVLMDLEMPRLDGIEATRQIVESRPEAAVVVLTSFSDQQRSQDGPGGISPTGHGFPPWPQFFGSCPSTITQVWSRRPSWVAAQSASVRPAMSFSLVSGFTR